MNLKNKLAEMPIRPLLYTMAVPLMLSLLIQSLYNIVDSIFVARLSETALTAASLVYAIQFLMIAIGVGTAVGLNALLSRKLGQKKPEEACRAATTGLFLMLGTSLVFTLVGLLFSNRIAAALTDDPELQQLCREYLSVNLVFCWGIFLQTYGQRLLQAVGDTVLSMVSLIIGAVANIILDPMMIFGLLGCPAMGIRGAAIATVIGQLVSALMVFYFHGKLDREVDKSPRYLKPQGRILKEIYQIGLPAIISQALLTVMTYGLNLILGRIPEVGENTVTVYGLYCKIQQMIIFAAVGVRDAITPIVSFNFGLRSRRRIQEGIRCGMLFTAVLMLIGLVLIELLAEPLTRFFSLSDVTYTICVDCIRIVSLGFLFAGICIAFQGVFQALECGLESLLISLGRQVVFILPVAWCITRFITGAENVALVWWTFLIGEGLTLLCALFMYARVIRKKLSGLEVKP